MQVYANVFIHLKEDYLIRTPVLVLKATEVAL
jgi:hypothetical protein